MTGFMQAQQNQPAGGKQKTEGDEACLGSTRPRLASKFYLECDKTMQKKRTQLFSIVTNGT